MLLNYNKTWQAKPAIEFLNFFPHIRRLGQRKEKKLYSAKKSAESPPQQNN